MIIGDENDLRERLDRPFEPVTAGPAPVESAVRRGKAISAWKTAAAGSAGGGCVPVTAGLGTSVMFWTARSPEVAFGNAAAPVTRVAVTQPDGTTTQIRPVQVGAQKFFAFTMDAGHKRVRWAAYDSSGGLVASSTLIPDA